MHDISLPSHTWYSNKYERVTIFIYFDSSVRNLNNEDDGQRNDLQREAQGESQSNRRIQHLLEQSLALARGRAERASRRAIIQQADLQCCEDVFHENAFTVMHTILVHPTWCFFCRHFPGISSFEQIS